MMTDPIADMLTRIRNGLQARKTAIGLPCSKIKLELARILIEEGYIQNYKKIEGDIQGSIQITFRRGPKGENVIDGLTRVSKPGCRIYCGKDEIPKVRGGLGINILSTSKGLKTGRQAARAGVGGEILCDVW